MKSLTPIYNVENLFNEYSTSIPGNADKADTQPSDHIMAAVIESLNQTCAFEAQELADSLSVLDRKLSGFADEHNLIRLYERRLHTTPHIFRTGYRIRNSNYKHNRNGYSPIMNGQNRGAKNKVFSKL